MKCSKQIYQLPNLSNDWPADVLTVFKKCFICNKQIVIGCGGYLIRYGGCCVGVRKGKQVYLASRSAHYECFNPKRRYKLMKVLK